MLKATCKKHEVPNRSSGASKAKIIDGSVAFVADVQPFFLRRRNMCFGEFEFAFAEFMKQPQEFPAGAELLKVSEANQNLHDLRIERRMHLHVVQQVDKARIEAIAPAVQRIRDAAADVFDRGQRVRDLYPMRAAQESLPARC